MNLGSVVDSFVPRYGLWMLEMEHYALYYYVFNQIVICVNHILVCCKKNHILVDHNQIHMQY